MTRKSFVLLSLILFILFYGIPLYAEDGEQAEANKNWMATAGWLYWDINNSIDDEDFDMEMEGDIYGGYCTLMYKGWAFSVTFLEGDVDSSAKGFGIVEYQDSEFKYVLRKGDLDKQDLMFSLSKSWFDIDLFNLNSSITWMFTYRYNRVDGDVTYWGRQNIFGMRVGIRDRDVDYEWHGLGAGLSMRIPVFEKAPGDLSLLGVGTAELLSVDGHIAGKDEIRESVDDLGLGFSWALGAGWGFLIPSTPIYFNVSGGWRGQYQWLSDDVKDSYLGWYFNSGLTVMF